MVVVDLVLILRIGVLAAHLPEEGMELVLVAILLEIVQKLDLLAVRLEIRPYIPVNRDDHLALQVLSHAQHVDGGHLVLHTDGVLSEGAERHVDVVVLAVLCEVNGEVRVSGVVDISARGLQQVVHCLLIHIGRALSGQLLAVLAGIVCGNDAGTVKAVEGHDLDILNLDYVSRLYGDAAVSRNAPLHPGLYRLLRSDERHRDLLAILIGGGHAALDYVGSPLCGHMVLMVMGSQNRVYLLERKRVDYERHVAQVRLHQAASAHIRHLMARLHLIVAMGSLSIAAPEVDGDVRPARCLHPDSGTAQPPHGYVSGSYYLVLDVFHQPGSPLRKGAHDPAVSCDVVNLGHISYFLS